ncbi:MAG: vanadium-dependent haloperoxidase [Planctomycetota bacterium]
MATVGGGGLPLTAWADDVVTDWNAVMSQVLVDNESLQNPGMSSRSMAMVNLAIYDSLKLGSGGDGSSFYDYGNALGGLGSTASREAAAAQAAYTVLSHIYSDQQVTLDTQLATSLAAFSDGVAKTDGVALGTLIGQSIINRRENDGYDTNVQYTPTNAVGHWQVDPLNPDQEAWGPAWGEVQTFAVQNVNDFMPPVMPSLDSAAYAEAYNEVKALGSVDSTTRTSEQTEIGIFWAYDRVGMGTPMRLFNDALRTIADDQGNTLDENAELFAKASVAMADAGIVAWNSKFELDFWRPVTGIRDGDLDGNALTEADADWTPLGAPDGESLTGFTPPFPTYLSGHATFGGAVFGVLQEFYGTDDIAFSLTSEELAVILADDDLRELYGLDADTDAVREFESLSEAMAENGRSRVYLGIHWNFDDTEGQITGASVASYLFDGEFIAAPEPATAALLVTGLLLMQTGRRRRS